MRCEWTKTTGTSRSDKALWNPRWKIVLFFHWHGPRPACGGIICCSPRVLVSRTLRGKAAPQPE